MFNKAFENVEFNSTFVNRNKPHFRRLFLSSNI